ncbi:branched-chain amino acid ABC transporter permease [Noviherbaspirillum galbum]|uniref:Branched-chain amino acid ABC transporter permease n=1 Tax=Noviherbaspirillum galbum TaxID=2709383 RepID=A0A6B3SFR5_9BURK|nr:branched-chain amino acid ABC transporter permease [Noviherbaspirillum galbum]
MPHPPHPSRSPGWIVPLAALFLLAALPAFTSSYTQDLVLKIIVYSVFALSLELLVGTTGLVSLGHAGFFGIAAYVTALGSPEAEPGSVLRLLPLAMLAAGAYAAFVGALSLRTRGVYFIMVTLAFAQMAFYVFHDTSIGGGSDGMYLTLRPALVIGDATLVDLDKGPQLYYFALAALGLTFGLLSLVKRSRFGQALEGIRINEQRMRAAGFQTYWYKLAAFILAGVLAGLAGFLMAAKNGTVNPEMLSWHESGAVLMMIILGGLGSLRGAVLGAAAFVLLKEFFSSEALLGDLAARWQLTLGITMIFLVALFPQGLAGIAKLKGRLFRRQAAAKETA